MVFKKQDNLQKIRYEIIRERIMRNHIINKLCYGIISIVIGLTLWLFNINIVIFILRFSQYIAFSNWELAAITSVSIGIMFVIAIALIGIGIDIFMQGAELEGEYKNNYGIGVF